MAGNPKAPAKLNREASRLEDVGSKNPFASRGGLGKK